MPFPCARSQRVADHGHACVVVDQHETLARVGCARVDDCVSVVGGLSDGELLHVVLSLVMKIGGLHPSAGVGLCRQ